MAEDELQVALAAVAGRDDWWDIEPALAERLDRALRDDPTAVVRALAAVLRDADDVAAERLASWLAGTGDRERYVSAVLDLDVAAGDPLAVDEWLWLPAPPDAPTATLARWLRHRLRIDPVGAAGVLITWQQQAERALWPLLAELLDDPATAQDLDRGRWSERFGSQRWAEADPRTVDRRLPDPGDLFSGIAADDPHRARAASEAGAVAATAAAWVVAGRSPEGWLQRLGSCLPGCGVAGCCRFGLFEAELLARGYQLRRRPVVTPLPSAR